MKTIEEIRTLAGTLPAPTTPLALLLFSNCFISTVRPGAARKSSTDAPKTFSMGVPLISAKRLLQYEMMPRLTVSAPSFIPSTRTR